MTFLRNTLICAALVSTLSVAQAGEEATPYSVHCRFSGGAIASATWKSSPADALGAIDIDAPITRNKLPARAGLPETYYYSADGEISLRWGVRKFAVSVSVDSTQDATVPQKGSFPVKLSVSSDGIELFETQSSGLSSKSGSKSIHFRDEAMVGFGAAAGYADFGGLCTIDQR